MRFLIKASVAGALWSGALLSPVHAAPEVRAVPEVVAVEGVVLTLLVERLHASELTVDEAFRGGELSVDEAVYLLGHASDWGAIEGRDNVPLRHALAKLVVEQEPGRMGEKLRQTPLKARLWIAEYLQVQRDERCVPVFESVLSELKAPVVGHASQALLFLSIERLAWFYEAGKEHVKTAETWLRLEPLLDKPNWMVADALIGAARSYAAAGREDKAHEFYAQVLQHGPSWFSGLALHDQMQELIQQSKYAEARTLLNQPAIGSYSEAVQVILLSTSGQLHYLSGDWAKAKDDSQAAITLFGSLNPEQQGRGLNAVINTAKARLDWSQQWLKAPMVVEPQQLRVIWRRGQVEKEPRTLKIWVRSGRAVPLQVSTNSESVNAVPKGKSNSNEYFSQQEVIVTIQSEKLSQDATVEIRSASFPNLTLSVPVDLETRNAIALYPSTVFFGEVQAGQAAQATLELSALMPFQILAVTSDDALVQVQPYTNGSGASHTLKLTFTSPQAGRFYSGTLRIQTDVPNEEVIEVPYVARVK